MQNYETLKSVLAAILEDYLKKFGEEELPTIAGHIDVAYTFLAEEGEEFTMDQLAEDAISSLLDNINDGEANEEYLHLQQIVTKEDFEDWYANLQVCQWIGHMANAIDEAPPV